MKIAIIFAAVIAISAPSAAQDSNTTADAPDTERMRMPPEREGADPDRIAQARKKHARIKAARQKQQRIKNARLKHKRIKHHRIKMARQKSAGRP